MLRCLITFINVSHNLMLTYLAIYMTVFAFTQTIDHVHIFGHTRKIIGICLAFLGLDRKGPLEEKGVTNGEATKLND